MAIKIGKYYVCDRCGATTFAAKTGEGETDGGFTKYDKFEEPEDWHFAYPDLKKSMCSKLLCPECSRQYDEMMKDFFGIDNENLS